VPLDGAPDAGIPEGPWFQFHGDRCLPPEEASVLARNEICVQAFRVGRHLGVQFHPELDAGQLARWIKAGADAELAEAGIDPEALLAETESLEGSAAIRVDRLVGAFLEHAG
jgi:GMP synthase-like glutamine amidotransferase